MTIAVDGNWWKDLFDDIYLLTDARSVCDDELTQKEIDFLEQFVLPDKSAAILDLCGGQGRHSLELARRGYKDLTVLDYSKYLVELGQKLARQENLKVTFVEADARDSGLPSGRFQNIIIMASSFGYFPDEQENRKILNETFRMLDSSGSLFLDLPSKDYVVNNFKPFSSHVVNDDLTATRQRELGDNVIFSRETVISKSKGLVRDRTYCTRLYSPEKITKMLKHAGFSSIASQNNFMSRETGLDYGCMTNRMIVTAEKKPE